LVRPIGLDMVEVASSNLAGPTKHKRARSERAFLCVEVYRTIGLVKPVSRTGLLPDQYSYFE